MPRFSLIVILSTLIALGLYLAAVTHISIEPFTVVGLPNSSIIVVEPGSSWRYIYLWINSRTMSVDEVKEMLEKLDMEPMAKRAVIDTLEEDVHGEIVYRDLWATIVRGEPSDLAIGINISAINPQNAVIELRISMPSGEVVAKTITLTKHSEVVYIPLTHSGPYVFTLINSASQPLKLGVSIVRGYVNISKPYLLPGIAILAISIPLLIYAIRKL